MGANAFASLAVLQMPPFSRLLPASCCPDKDLVLVVSRLGGKDRLSLWKMQGSKKWEIDIYTDGSHNEEIVDLAWSPNGQTIVVLHDPPRITLHSIQDGRKDRDVPILHPLPEKTRLTGVWWFVEEKDTTVGSIPDIFKRGDNITGSAHSILKILPLLDSVKDDTQPLPVNGLFAFSDSHTNISRSDMPEAIASWPTLPFDPLTASIQPPPHVTEHGSEEFDESNNIDENSILAVADNIGCLHCFLDGSYPLGAVSILPQSTTSSLHKGSRTSTLVAHQRVENGKSSITPLLPTSVCFPLLKKRIPRDLARISTTTRELLWYTMRVMDDLHTIWFGTTTQPGARELGERWIHSLGALQPDPSGGNRVSQSILDLVHFLITGRPSDAVSDFIGSGEQMSERGLQKWESTVIEALIKIRDFSQQRIALAFQRVYLMLEEVLGWSQLPQLYGLCELQTEDIEQCLKMTNRAITAASWLSATARRELSHFREFMKWLRYEIAIASNTSDGHTVPQPRHDVLEVDSYLMSGLINSQVDKFFRHGVAHFQSRDLGVPDEPPDLSAAMKRARNALKDPTQTSLQHAVAQDDHHHVDRNLHLLVQDLAKRCGAIFLCAASATARSAEVSHETRPSSGPSSFPSDDRYSIWERTIVDEEAPSRVVQHLAIHVPSAEYRTCLCLTRLRYGHEAPSLNDLGVAILECRLREDSHGIVDFDLLDADFFDDESLVIVYRAQGVSGPTYIAIVAYSDVEFQEVQAQEYVNEPSREGLMLDTFQRWKDGQLQPVFMPIKRSRVLSVGREGDVSLAVNGRAGRRVACVLDSRGVLETLDLEGDETGEESE